MQKKCIFWILLATWSYYSFYSRCFCKAQCSKQQLLTVIHDHDKVGSKVCTLLLKVIYAKYDEHWKLTALNSYQDRQNHGFFYGRLGFTSKYPQLLLENYCLRLWWPVMIPGHVWWLCCASWHRHYTTMLGCQRFKQTIESLKNVIILCIFSRFVVQFHWYFISKYIW